MSDPISIAGTAAGLVSLGIQVYQGLVFYIDSVKGRKEDLLTVASETQNLRNIVASIQNMKPSFQAPEHQHITSSVVTPALDACDRELRALGDFLAELTAPPTGSLAKIQDQTRKITYPFKRGILDRLEKRLQSANGVLQTATTTLQL